MAEEINTLFRPENVGTVFEFCSDLICFVGRMEMRK